MSNIVYRLSRNDRACAICPRSREIDLEFLELYALMSTTTQLLKTKFKGRIIPFSVSKFILLWDCFLSIRNVFLFILFLFSFPALIHSSTHFFGSTSCAHFNSRTGQFFGPWEQWDSSSGNFSSSMHPDLHKRPPVGELNETLRPSGLKTILERATRSIGKDSGRPTGAERESVRIWHKPAIYLRYRSCYMCMDRYRK